MRSILRYCLIFAVSFVCAAFLFAWPDVRPHAVLAIVIALRVVVGVLTVCLCALAIGWTGWRLSVVRADTLVARQAVEFARSLGQPAPTLDTEHAWRIAYLQFCFIAYSVGSMAFRKMRPYFEKNAQVYWEAMTDALLAAGWAYVDERGTTRFRGHFRAFQGLVASRRLVLPHPQALPPPVMRWVRAENTPFTLALENTPPKGGLTP